MNFFLRLAQYVLFTIGIALYGCLAASFFLPENSVPEIIYNKTKHIGLALIAIASVLRLTEENKKLREQLKEKSK